MLASFSSLVVVDAGARPLDLLQPHDVYLHVVIVPDVCAALDSELMAMPMLHCSVFVQLSGTSSISDIVAP